jgi:glycosyltransferase involved in cell wall biosynthesis
VTTLLNYVVDQKGWVQHKRVTNLARAQHRYRFRVLSVREFKWAWKFRLLRDQPVVFSTWRVVHQLMKDRPNLFSEPDFDHFLGAVTSHSTIGGGLDPLNPIPGRTPEEAFELAVGLLRQFKVVTVNSKILFDLLSPALDRVMYCANGVDCEFFTPADGKPSRMPLRVGWVGKIRGPKNFPVVKEALEHLEETGKFKPEVIAVDKDMRNRKLNASEMRDFFQNIDFYLCASWNEGTPNPALEAAACGVPVVTTRVGNMPELIDPGINGYFVEPTVASIVERFLEIARMPEGRYISMSKNIRQSARDLWSWESRIGGFLSAFDALID